MPCDRHPVQTRRACPACQASAPAPSPPRPAGRPVGIPSHKKIHASDAARMRAHYERVTKPRRAAESAARKAAKGKGEKE